MINNIHIMKKEIKYIALLLFMAFGFSSCNNLKVKIREEQNNLPEKYQQEHTSDTLNSANMNWKDFFQDQNLVALIDTALNNNQELNIMLQEIEVLRSEIGAKKGEYLPTVSGYVGAGAEKVSRYTRDGAVEATTDIVEGKEFPEPLQDYTFGIRANWEIDIWKKLRNGKKAAVEEYLASVSGQQFMKTHLIAEIATAYYELLALDNQIERIEQNIVWQKNALQIAKQQKASALISELAVKRFEAQLLNTQSLKYEIEQERIETENEINYLLGRYPQAIERTQESFNTTPFLALQYGLPSQLLANRMDIKQAEHQLESRKLNVKVARARFYPSIGISAGIGLQAFDPSYLVKTPKSLLFSLAGDLVAPLINRAGIKAQYQQANAKQLQAVFEYEKTILSAYIEVSNQLSRSKNLAQSFAYKNKEVEALNRSIQISNTLFKSARADYLEILLTQEETIDAQFELIEIKKQQLNTMVNTYVALGGGWE